MEGGPPQSTLDKIAQLLRTQCLLKMPSWKKYMQPYKFKNLANKNYYYWIHTVVNASVVT